ncbi:hypothetical protein D5R95_07610, partial [Methanosalsum natronophilum]
MSLYNFRKRIEHAEKRIIDADYSQKNKDLIFEFVNVLYAEGLSDARVLKYLSQLNLLAQMFNKEFDEVTLTDMYRVVAEIERSDRKPWTKHDYKVAIKRFFKWLNGGEDPDTTKWIKTAIKQHNKMLPEELLTDDDIRNMINAADHPRDKAMIAFLYDSGTRVGEMASIKLKHIAFDKYGATVMVNGKTGMRRVRLIFSPPYVSSWLAIHPNREDPNTNLWVNVGNRGRG